MTRRRATTAAIGNSIRASKSRETPFELKEDVRRKLSELLRGKSREFLSRLVSFRVEVVLGKEESWDALPGTIGSSRRAFVLASKQLIVNVCAEFLELYWR